LRRGNSLSRENSRCGINNSAGKKMIIRRKPEDFRVEELTGATPGADGAFALYRLEKTGWTTPDALAAVRRRWKIEVRRLSYGGLKDRHAQTTQYFTIYRGPQRKLTHSGVQVEYLGQVGEPFTSQQIEANRFELVLRRMSRAEADYATANLPEVQDFGVPNYFDDQRFGSVAGGGPFMARSLLQGDHEEALRVALTASYPHDRKEQKNEKDIVRGLWGNWERCKERLPRSHARSLVDYLVTHPTDFAGALERLRPELRGLYLSAYQSFLWNRILAAWIEAILPPEDLVRVGLMLGAVPMPRRLTSDQQALLESSRIPLPSPKAQREDDDPIAAPMQQVLEKEGVTLDQFRLRGLKEVFFSRGDRPALCMPRELKWSREADDMHPGKEMMTLTFDLPRGSYATLIVKRISTTAPEGEAEE